MLILVAVISNIGYRQLSSIWRSIALFNWCRQRQSGGLPEYIAPKQIR